ncbi:TetR/AcrR family transcriptional regulator [Glycomyces terrestris]|uniref:TetR/AcrR family transcriptional regulator n=1 Tax=Glycomyces terrestris TaxID=2493553 RepID=A0A426V4G2_9ACTN|nr:TetR/AcrR family transcriptional regulator [Glycomyces terrestris]RRS01710.1 TetR/AcrR family transcriptional regulator [Glycomyces terrestris]
MTSANPQRRSERARTAILKAVLEACSEQGYGSMTMEGIAKRAGVGKQTIYRWWPSKGAVLQEALNGMIGAETDFPDTGDIAADLRTQMTRVVALLEGEIGTYVSGLIAAAQAEPELAETMVANIFGPRVEACRQRLERAVRQGQIRSDADLVGIAELLYAPLYYRMLLRTRPVSTEQVGQILELVFSGIAPTGSREVAAARPERPGE